MRRALPIGSTLLLLALASAPVSLPAANPPAKDPTADPTLISAGFLSGHPDMRYRLLAQRELADKSPEDAFRFFQRASFYGDKPSQAMVAEMLWEGKGTTRDRALAYAWMDLASERGYVDFLRFRERYWAALDETERNRAITEGQAIYARYGDAAAQPRIEAVLRREKRKATGSRTGFAGNVQIYVPGPGGTEQIDGSKFYDPQYWDPARYRAWQDAIWMAPRTGIVSVGAPETVKSGATPPASRVPATAPDQKASEPTTPERDETGLGTQRPVKP